MFERAESEDGCEWLEWILFAMAIGPICLFIAV